MKQKIIVVGGGASGMVAAIAAARSGADVTILEQKDQLGKKILSTGNGRCNFTNDKMDRSCFRGEEPSIVSNVLKKFGTKDTLSFFEELGILAKSRNGYYYPKSDQASSIVDVLTMELQRLQVCVVCNTKVLTIQKKKHFLIHTDKNNYEADCVILAAGGKASPVLGSDGSGYSLAKSFGHHLTPIVPALVQLHGKGTFFKMVSGVRVDAKVSLFVEDELLATDIGELQLTNYGISGIPVFQISRYAALALLKGQRPMAILDFIPEYSTTEFVQYLKERARNNPNKTAEEYLVGMLNKKLAPVLLRASGIQMDTKVKQFTEEQIHKLAEKCKSFSIEIIKTNSFEQAQICAGGVKTTEISPDTMESNIVKNLYITGELLDIDGICGGYNLQWAWATGMIAGKAAAGSL